MKVNLIEASVYIEGRGDARIIDQGGAQGDERLYNIRSNDSLTRDADVNVLITTSQLRAIRDLANMALGETS